MPACTAVCLKAMEQAENEACSDIFDFPCHGQVAEAMLIDYQQHREFRHDLADGIDDCVADAIKTLQAFACYGMRQ